MIIASRMRRVRAFALVLLASACSKTERGPDELPPETWATRVPVWYRDDVLDRCAFSGIEPLQEKELPPSAFEVRVWGGFGLQAAMPGGHSLEGLLLRREGDTSSGVHYPRACGSKTVTPASGWPSFWHAVQDAGLYELRDCRHIAGWNDVLDGIVYVVEIRHGDRYRSYHYGNPSMQHVPEAARFLRLLAILREQTGFDARP